MVHSSNNSYIADQCLVVIRVGPGDLLYASMTVLAGDFPADAIQNLDLEAISSIRYLIGECIERYRILPLISECFAASAVALSLWDHVLIFPREIEAIWSRRLDIAKITFLVYRYGIEAGLIFVAHSTSSRSLVLTAVLYTVPSSGRSWFEVNY